MGFAQNMVESLVIRFELMSGVGELTRFIARAEHEPIEGSGFEEKADVQTAVCCRTY
jgi:hypothetical protein